MVFNKFQTPLENLHYKDKEGKEYTWQAAPDEIKEEFSMYIASVPLIRWLISPDRPYVKDLPRDESGRAIIDITHPPILEDTDYFRQTALHYKKTGKLTDLRPNRNPNSEYMKWFNEENNRIWNGYLREEDGAYIPGYMYWYLNYSPITLTRTINGIDYRVPDMPDFWEGVWWRMYGWYEARRDKANFAEISSRGKSKSYSLASGLSRVYTLGDFQPPKGMPIKNASAVVMASTKEFLIKDGTLNKFEDIVGFLADHTQYPAKQLQASLKEMTWQHGYIDLDSGTKKGTLNTVLGVAVKEDVDKGRGKRAAFIALEEFGAFPNVDDVYNIALPSVTDGDKTFGLIALCGTGGSEGADFSGAMNMIYHPKGYGIKSYENVWDIEGKAKSTSIFCFPAYVNRSGCMNDDGVSDVTLALFRICCERYIKKYNTSDPMQLTRTKAEYPVTLQDAIMQVGGNYFPTAQLLERVQEIDADPNFYDSVYVGDIRQSSNGAVEFTPTDDVPIRSYPHKDNKMEGAVEIYEMPQKDRDGKVFNGRYIGGLDPINNDESETMSLVSLFIMDLWTDRIVCEWTGRLSTADECYEKVRLIALFYNAKINYENNLKGVFTYFKTMNSLHLLMKTLEILKDKTYQKESLNNTSYGVTATAQVNQTARFFIKDWLLSSTNIIKTVDGEEQEITVHKYNLIKQRALLQELASWNTHNNFDRCVLKDTQILTKNGIKKVSDIKKGDYVLSSSGHYNVVEETMKHDYSGTLYRIKLTGDYRYLECTDNHPILIRQRGKIVPKKWMEQRALLGESKYVRADEVNKASDFMFVPKRKGLLPTTLPDDLLYLIGWYISDGNASTGHYVKFFLSEYQYEIAKDIQAILEKYFGRDETFVKGRYDKNGRFVTPYYTPQGAHTRLIHDKRKYKGRLTKMWIVEICSEEAQKFFIHYGGPAHHKTIRESLYNSSGLMPLIRGYFEGDGHYRCDVRSDSYERNSLEATGIYEEMMHKIRQILLDEGIWSSIRFVPARKKNYRDQYTISVSGKDVLPIISGSKKFKQVERTDRKWYRDTAIRTEDGYWVKAAKIESLPCEETVYNISVSNEHNYVSNGFVTHNCSALGILMLARQELIVSTRGDFGRKKKDMAYKGNDPFFERNYKR